MTGAAALCGSLALIVVLVSATGGERVSVGMLAVGLGLAVLLIGGAAIAHSRQAQRGEAYFLGAATLSLVTIASIPLTNWPLRLSYAISRGAFDSVARTVLEGESIGPQRIGLLPIREVELSRAGVVCLWTDLNPAGKTGFVQCGPENPPFNLWSMVELDQDWQFISED